MAVPDRSTASLEAPRQASPGREALSLLAVTATLLAVVPLLAFTGGSFLVYFTHH